MEATVLIADWAEAINGKLYIQGGGWTQVATGGNPINCALAVRILVGWDEANEKHSVRFRLVDDDGRPVVNPAGEPVEWTTQFEVGRPPGLVKGSDLDAALAVQLHGLPLQPGRYSFMLEIDEQPKGVAAFSVI